MVSSALYVYVRRSLFKDISFECFSCGPPNFSLSLFDTTIFETSITFSYISETISSDQVFLNPVATSCPSKVKPRREDLPMKVLILNTQSNKSSDKPAQLQTMIQSTNVDIVIGPESVLNPNNSSSEVFSPPDSTYYRNDRSSDKGGGVFLLVSNKFDSYEPSELMQKMNVNLPGPSSKFKDLSIYTLALATFSQLWTRGDFNLADIDWNDECVQSYPSYEAQCQQLLKSSKDVFLGQMITEPTRDHDHEAVFVESSLRQNKKQTRPRRTFKYQNDEYDGFRQELNDLTPCFSKMSTPWAYIHCG